MKLTKLTYSLLGCLSIASLLTGCSSIVCGPQQKVAIDSVPNGAKVMIYNARDEVVFDATTPCVAKLKRGGPGSMEAGQYVVVLTKDGYSPVQVSLSGVVNRAYPLNALNLVGLIVDPITGAMWTLEPENLDEKLVSESAAFFKNSGGLMICLKQEVPKDLQPYLTPVQN